MLVSLTSSTDKPHLMDTLYNTHLNMLVSLTSSTDKPHLMDTL